MKNKVLDYPQLVNKSIVSFEVISTLGGQLIVELTQSLDIPTILDIGGANAIQTPIREHWVRTTSKNLVINTLTEQELNKKFPMFRFFCHRIETRVFNTNMDLTELQKVIKAYNGVGSVFVDSSIEFDIRVFIDDIKLKKHYKVRTLENDINSLLNINTTRVFVDHNSIQFNRLSNIGCWYDLRNIFFMAHEVAKTININNVLHYNLEEEVTLPILQDYFLTKKEKRD